MINCFLWKKICVTSSSNSDLVDLAHQLLCLQQHLLQKLYLNWRFKSQLKTHQSKKRKKMKAARIVKLMIKTKKTTVWVLRANPYNL